MGTEKEEQDIREEINKMDADRNALQLAECRVAAAGFNCLLAVLADAGELDEHDLETIEAAMRMDVPYSYRTETQAEAALQRLKVQFDELRQRIRVS